MTRDERAALGRLRRVLETSDVGRDASLATRVPAC
jgi:hypothetical protein